MRTGRVLFSLVVCGLSLLLSGLASAQQWAKTYGGTSWDYANSIQPTTDGGAIMAGYTSSFGAGHGDAWVLKLDSLGTIAGCAAQGTSSATVTNTTEIGANTTSSVATTAVTGSATSVTPHVATASPTPACSTPTKV